VAGVRDCEARVIEFGRLEEFDDLSSKGPFDRVKYDNDNSNASYTSKFTGDYKEVSR